MHALHLIAALMAAKILKYTKKNFNQISKGNTQAKIENKRAARSWMEEEGFDEDTGTYWKVQQTRQ